MFRSNTPFLDSLDLSPPPQREKRGNKSTSHPGSTRTTRVAAVSVSPRAPTPVVRSSTGGDTPGSALWNCATMAWRAAAEVIVPSMRRNGSGGAAAAGAEAVAEAAEGTPGEPSPSPLSPSNSHGSMPAPLPAASPAISASPPSMSAAPRSKSLITCPGSARPLPVRPARPPASPSLSPNRFLSSGWKPVC